MRVLLWYCFWWLAECTACGIIVDRDEEFGLRMSDAIIYLHPDSKLNLQNQIRQKRVDGILNWRISTQAATGK
jgi:hypothetical protein